MRDLFVAAIVFGTLPFVLRRPFIGILLLTWLGYMNPHLLCYGFMLSMPVVYIVTIVTLIGMVATDRTKRMVWSREVVVLLLFLVWMAITTTQAFYPELAMIQLIKVLKIQTLTLMALVMLSTELRVRSFIWIIVLSIGFYGVKGGLFTIAHGGSYRVQGPPTSFISENNELALALVMTIPLMRYLQVREPNRWVKLGLTGAMVLMAIGAIGSQSRGALVALALTGLIFWIKSRKKFMTLAMIVTAVVSIAAIMPSAWYERMNTIKTYDQDESALGRLNAWGMAWNLARDRFLGGGFDTFRPEVFARYGPEPNRVHDVHSIYFGVLGHHGFVGLFLFLLLLVLTWMKCSAVIKRVRKRPEFEWAGQLAGMIQVSLVGYMSAGAFLGLMYFDYPYHLMVVAVVLYAMVSATPRPSPVGVPPPGASHPAPPGLTART